MKVIEGTSKGHIEWGNPQPERQTAHILSSETPSSKSTFKYITQSNLRNYKGKNGISGDMAEWLKH